MADRYPADRYDDEPEEYCCRPCRRGHFGCEGGGCIGAGRGDFAVRPPRPQAVIDAERVAVDKYKAEQAVINRAAHSYMLVMSPYEFWACGFKVNLATMRVMRVAA